MRIDVVYLGAKHAPGESKKFPIIIVISRDETDDVFWKSKDEITSMFGVLTMACCVFYKTIYDHNGSARSFFFTAMKDNGAFGSPIFLDDVPVDTDNLVIRKTWAESQTGIDASKTEGEKPA